MATDDLSAPLGRQKPKYDAAIPAMAMRATAALLGLFVAVFVIWAAVVDDPLRLGDAIAADDAPK